MNVIGYTKFGSIRVIFEGEEGESIVPDDVDNRERQAIAAWESEGNVIPPHVPLPEPMPVLSSRQFWLAAADIGITKQSLLDSVAENYTGMEAEMLSIEIRESTSFERDYPLVDELADIKGISREELDALWNWASGI